MNKEETIKDIQNIINANCWTISEHFAKNVATALYNAGYGKVPDGAVILTPEERDEELKGEKRNEVKEFAEKLKAKAFDKDMFNDWAGATYVVLVREIDKLLKEYEK